MNTYRFQEFKTEEKLPSALELVPTRKVKLINTIPHQHKMAKGAKKGNKKTHPKQKSRPGETRKEHPKDYKIMPREFLPNPQMFFKRRYGATANVFGNFTIVHALSALIVATTTVLGNSILSAIRIKRIQIWAPVVTNGTPVTIVLTPVTVDPGNNCFTDLPETITDTSQTLDTPAYIDYKPALDHPAGSWHASTAVDANLIQILAPQGAIMDVEYIGVINTTFTKTAFSVVLVGATAGTIYARNAAGNFNPVSVNNI